MLILLLSISCSVAVSVLLKVARSLNVDLVPAIAVNYACATALTVLLLRPQPWALTTDFSGWWTLGTLGLLLPSVFLIMAVAVRHAGIVLSDAAQRLSLTVPLLAAFLLFNETLTDNKLWGIALAFCALSCLLIKPGSRRTTSSKSGRTALLLLGVWLGYGLIDILFKQLARTGTSFSTSLLGAFVLAGVVMAAIALKQKCRWTARNLTAGILLGMLNFGNIYFYIRAHQHFPDNPSLVFASMNIGVISMGTLIGALVFRESLSRLNMGGIFLALMAVLVLFG